jgi:hypothetical protein
MIKTKLNKSKLKFNLIKMLILLFIEYLFGFLKHNMVDTFLGH